MLTTIEAEIDVDGRVTLLEPVRLTRRSRAIVTLLDNGDAEQATVSEEEMQRAEARFAGHFGAVESSDPHSADNERIDADLIRAYQDTHDHE